MSRANTIELEKIIALLPHLTPGERVKYLRKNILKKNQTEFCDDRIISLSTLKAIESQALKLSDKVAGKIKYKFSTEGVLCSTNMFSYDLTDEVNVTINQGVFDQNQHLESELTDYHSTIPSLIPARLESEMYEPYYCSGTLLFLEELNRNQIRATDNILCATSVPIKRLYRIIVKNDELMLASLNDDEKLQPLTHERVFIVRATYVKAPQS